MLVPDISFRLGMIHIMTSMHVVQYSRPLTSFVLLCAFIFSINLLILSGFPSASFHLVETSQSAFSWLYTLVCAVVQKFNEMFFIYNCSHF